MNVHAPAIPLTNLAQQRENTLAVDIIDKDVAAIDAAVVYMNEAAGDSDEYLLTLTRYIVLNPVRARMVEKPRDWKWSSYRATAGLVTAPPWLETRLILDRFDEWNRTNAHQLYRQFVAAGASLQESPGENLVAGLYLGSRELIDRIKPLIGEREPARDDTLAPHLTKAHCIDAVADAVTRAAGVSLAPKTWRNERARAAFAHLSSVLTTAPVTQIATKLALSPSGVSSKTAIRE